MPRALPQMDSSWCYFYSADAIIKQHFCSQKTSCPTASQPSLRGVIGTYHNRSESDAEAQNSRAHGWVAKDWKKPDWEESGFAPEVLHSVAKSGKVASENCAPTSDFIKWTSLRNDERAGKGNPIASLEYYYRAQRLSLEWGDASWTGKDCDETIPLTNGSPAHDLARFTKDALAAMSGSRDAKSYVKRVLVPEVCEQSAVTLPPFTVKSSNPSGFDEIQRSLKTMVSRRKPAIISLCANALNEQPGCGGHAVALAGSRKRCCGQVCREEFKILDSAFVGGGEVDPNDQSTWVESGRLIEAIERRQQERAADRVALRQTEEFYQRALKEQPDNYVTRMRLDAARRMQQNIALITWIE